MYTFYMVKRTCSLNLSVMVVRLNIGDLHAVRPEKNCQMSVKVAQK